jgi:hypothetical protein
MTMLNLTEIAARTAHEVNRAYCRSLGDESQPTWALAPEWQRQSAIKGVEFVRDNPTADAASQHESWLSEKKATGWTYGPVKDTAAKTHPCFVPYDQLPKDQQLKDALFGASVRAVLGI